ncbi:YheC/YheD family protein [Ammoniphilus sp. CFH 90114]|uniref:YheC/YheD family protein n=1 Tax=Ammoniphilus sp. CFH 90114 TaxID=2493665 RepID=UPI0013E955BB|nr:YheC/YheD family protein [Ammoniphilus sp. CFH 90114]
MKEKHYTFRLPSKWTKTQALMKNSQVARWVPATKKLTTANLRAMLGQYAMIYIKPDRGSKGIGVMQIAKSGGSGSTVYRCQTGIKVRSFSSYESMEKYVLAFAGIKDYLIQKGIQLTQFNGRAYDLRVMVQIGPRQQWETTGMVGRLAQQGRIVTNGSQGAESVSVDILFPKPQTKRLKARLNHLGLTTANHLQKLYPAIREIGLDVAFDPQFKPWILEVNTFPEPHPFMKLEDQRMFRKIIRYGKAYGRYKGFRV